jgi:hypothetical protein
MEGTKGMTAVLSDYKHLLADRPAKFTGTESGYTPAAKNKTEYTCDDCRHFFTGPAAGYSVCEVVRLVPEKSIEPKAKCKFWTRTGERFPLLNGKE